jgi:acyl-CoA synthetase (AMP-forming)/AMP-acid ligase II
MAVSKGQQSCLTRAASPVRDPASILATRSLIQPGGPYETCFAMRGGQLVEVFAHHPQTLNALWLQAAEPRLRRALVDQDREYSAAELFDRAAALAQWLRQDKGIVRGATVGIALPAGMNLMTCFIAITAIGARAAMLNIRGAGEELAHASRSAGTVLIIADAERLAALSSFQADLAATCVGEDELAPAALRHSGAAFAPAPVQPEDSAAILFTSGTTGWPKPVLHTHGSLAHTAVLGGLVADLQDLTFEREFGQSVPPERRAASAATVIASPMFHMSGITPFLRGLCFRATLFVMTRWNAETALSLMERETVTRLGFVPAMLLDMIRSPLANDRNLGSINLLANGAAALDVRIVEEIRRRMPQVMLANSYGMTESGAWGTSIYGQDYLDHPASAGYALPTLQLRIARPDDSEAPAGEHGEILLRGASVMREYIGFPDETAETLCGGWLHTGDVGWLDDDGRLFIADRIKNMIISGGENVYAAEVERVLNECPGVAESLVFGLPDERLGERVVAAVVARDGALPGEDELRRLLRQRLAGYKVPKQIFGLDEALPRTSTLKVDRGTFLRRFREDKARQGS